MTTITAVLTRAGLLPAAAALLLIGSMCARAEAPKAADYQVTDPAIGAAVAEQKPGTESQASSEKKAAEAAATAPAATKQEGNASTTAAASQPAADPAVKPGMPEPGQPSGTSAQADPAKGDAPKDKDAGTASTAAATKTDAPTQGTPETQGTPDKAAQSTSLQGTGAQSTGAQSTGAQTGAPSAVPGPTAALPDPATTAPNSGPNAGVSDAALPPADAIVASVRQLIPTVAKGSNADDVAALAAFYEELEGPAVWASTSGLTPKAKAVAAEVKKADDWGLPASDFDLPHLSSATLSSEAAAEAEIKVAQVVLRYARYARGGRINPSSISQLMDQSPTLRAPKTVLTEISATDAPDAYLRALHPKHEQFERLRQVLLKLRGSDSEKEEEPTEDPALAVKIPPGRLLRGGMEDPQVALLRQRLKVPAEDPAAENVYDDKLQAAVRDFQRANGLLADALIGNTTRAVLNGQPKPVVASADSKIERILINMERWRWMPEDMGTFYVWDNVPEFLTRIVKNDKIIHTDKIIVGQPSWPTPMFSADMKTIVFHPSWGVPEGIKRKELAPLLRKSSGGAGLFGIFGGGYSAQAVLDAYQLRVYYGGRQIDPNQVDWSSANISSYSFQQPPGPKNVLGDVKFMFPNKHDVYMHDTPERHLFVKSFRALSHGCMRIAEPRRFAEVLLGEDKGWSSEKVRSMFGGYSSEVALSTHIPVHVTYFTARVDDSGKLLTFGDFYGLDSRTAAALTGRSVRFEAPVYADDGPIAASDPGDPFAAQQQRRQPRKKQNQGPPTLADAISDIFSP
jgi:murein L,D-transpeptidase YcbB/YkuD